MTICFLTRQVPVCLKIAGNLRVNGNECLIYDSTASFHSAMVCRTLRPDLLVFDYSLFNHLIFNVYQYMAEHNCSVPLIFYNDPYPGYQNRAFYWKNMLSLLYPEPKFKIRLYEEILESISESVDSMETEMPPAAPFAGRRQDAACVRPMANIADGLSASAYLVYETLCENTERVVPIQELQMKIRRGDSVPKETTIFCIISKIRTAIGQNQKDKIDIIKTGDGYRLIVH